MDGQPSGGIPNSMSIRRYFSTDVNGKIVHHYDQLIEVAVEIHDFFSDMPVGSDRTEAMAIADEIITWAEGELNGKA